MKNSGSTKVVRVSAEEYLRQGLEEIALREANPYPTCELKVGDKVIWYRHALGGWTKNPIAGYRKPYLMVFGTIVEKGLRNSRMATESGSGPSIPKKIFSFQK